MFARLLPVHATRIAIARYRLTVRLSVQSTGHKLLCVHDRLVGATSHHPPLHIIMRHTARATAMHLRTGTCGTTTHQQSGTIDATDVTTPRGNSQHLPTREQPSTSALSSPNAHCVVGNINHLSLQYVMAMYVVFLFNAQCFAHVRMRSVICSIMRTRSGN
jgi:hypothetical protein